VVDAWKFHRPPESTEKAKVDKDFNNIVMIVTNTESVLLLARLYPWQAFPSAHVQDHTDP
jgi:hypothetical protein